MPNFSPLRNSDALFINSLDQLENKIEEIENNQLIKKVDLKKLFYLNQDLNKWSQLIDSLQF